MGGDPDETARNTLADMQARLASGPYAVLAIAPNASATEARSAFLELTKIYHPARFSRLSADVQRLANEIFLGIKGAHEALAKTSGWQTRGQPGAQPPIGSAPIATSAPGAAASTRATGSIATLPAAGATVARGTGARPAQPTVPVQPTPAARPGPGAPHPTRAPTGQAPTLARPPSPAPTAPARATTPPGPGAAGARPSTPSPAPGARPGTPSPAPASRPTTSGPAAGAPRGAPQTVQPWKPTVSGAARAASPVPTAAATGTKPPAGSFDERAELMIVMDLVRKGQWPAARQALQNLAARVPGSTNYKALLAYARAREAQQANRPDEAILELQRALQLDPNLSLAKTALAELQRAKK